MGDSTKKLTTSEILARVAKLPPEERKRAERALLIQYQPSAIVNRTPEAEELEAQGWEVWLQELAPHVFRGTHAPFHRDFWNWYWPLLMAKRDGKRLVSMTEVMDGRTVQMALAYLMTLARGLGKSTTAEWATIAMGAILGNVLALYISSVAKLAKGHLTNIREEIEDSQITKYYPGLSNPEVGKHNNRYGWNQDLLSTMSGLTIFAIGLEEEVRGVKRRQLRPSLIVIDEFDSKTDSPDVVKKKESIIGGSIFGTQVEDTIILMAQNLIHGQSVALRTYKRRNELLSHRRESGLIRAFTEDLEIEMVGTRWQVTKGAPIWPYFDERAFQKFLDTSGPIETFAEYQHDFSRDKEGKIFKNYRDKDAEGFTHVITEDEFANVYGVRRPPASWNKWMFNDKSRTKSEFHANVAGTLTMSSQNTPLPGVTFLYDCLTFEANAQPDDCAIEMLKCITPYVRVDGIDYRWEDLLRVIVAREGIERFTGSLYEQIRAQRSGLAKIIPKYVAPLLASQHYQKFRMSHEADDWRKVYREVFGLPFVAANPAEGQGLELMDLTMKVDETVRDPFRPWQMGMSRFYIIVPQGKVSYPNDNKPDLLFGSDLARYQFTEQRWLSSKVTATGEKERGPEKRNDDFANGCFVADTLIRTFTGERPIQEVRAGDWVWTRAGWRKVLAAGMTDPAAEVFTLETSVGQLRGTGDHPVWVEGKGFIPLRVLSMDDILHSCPITRHDPSPSVLFSKALPSTVIPTQSRSLTVDTTSRTLAIAKRVLATFTLKYGSRFMARYPGASRSTTWMGIGTTMNRTTWERSPAASMRVFTFKSGFPILNRWLPPKPKWPRFDLSLMLGTLPPKAENGIAIRPQRWIENCIRALVSTAVKSTRLPFPPEASFALASAGNDSDRVLRWAWKLEPVKYAATNSLRTRAMTPRSVERPVSLGVTGKSRYEQFPVLVAAPPSKPLEKDKNTALRPVVRKVSKSGIAPVYNLQVEGQPEYFANGILVHNCQFFYMDHSIQARELTAEEMFEAQLAPPLQQAAIDAETDPEKKRQQHYAREVAIRRQLMAKITENLGGGRTRGSAGSRLADYRSLERQGK